MEAWFLYKPTTEGLGEVLREIQRQLVSFGLPFLVDAERRLRTNRLLQAALAAAKGVPAESRAGLTDAAVSVGYSLDELKHPA